MWKEIECRWWTRMPDGGRSGPSAAPVAARKKRTRRYRAPAECGKKSACKCIGRLGALQQAVILAWPRGSRGGRLLHESCPFDDAVAHAPAAVSRSLDRAIRAALDAAARAQGLLGHGPSARGISPRACHVQYCAVAGGAARG